MSVTIELPDEVLTDLEAEAARRETTVSDFIAQTVTELVTVHAPPELPRKFSLAGIGASTGTRFACDADELLAEGFGRD